MSIGTGGKLFGKGFEVYVGKTSYTHSLSLVSVGIVALDKKFSLLSVEVAIRW